MVRRPAPRRKAKLPDQVVFETKPQLATDLCERAAGVRMAERERLASS